MYRKAKNHYQQNKKLYWIALVLMLVTVPSLAAGLYMSFYVQAPYNHWTQPWADACEETSIAMVDSYYNKISGGVNDGKDDIMKIMAIKNKYYGESYDENAQEIVNIVNNFTDWEARVVKAPKLEDLTTELDAGRLIILPTHARELKNKFYKTANMDYHVIVLSGYDAEKEEFITQDPGTKNGANLRYGAGMIMTAMHDFLPEDQTKNAPAVAVFTSSEITKLSSGLDGDKDGLNKADELKYKTNLAEPDTDHDGFTDGEEVKNGFLPTTDESKLGNGNLVRSVESKEVFLLKDNKRWKVLNELVMIKNKWSWGQVKNVSEKFLKNYPLGGEIK